MGSSLFKVDEKRIDGGALAERVREVLRAESRPPVVRASEPGAAASHLAAVDAAVAMAASHWEVGTRLPPMSRLGRAVRSVARPVAHAILRAAQLVTRDQRSFNQAALQALRHLRDAVERVQIEGSVALRGLEARVVDLEVEREKLHAEVVRLRQEVGRLRDRQESGKPSPVEDRAYFDFEERFRGARSEIRARVREYVPLLREAGRGEGRPIVDLGCGRGELLEELRDAGLLAEGVDASPAMVKECERHGLRAMEGEALDHLRSRDPGTLGGLCALHLIEHLPFEILVGLVEEAKRVLAPGGALILETPNPQSLMVGACSFYIDPTHLRPVHPDTLRFLLESRGFARVEIRAMRPVVSLGSPAQARDPLLDTVAHHVLGPQDYAAIAYAPAAGVQG